MFRRCRSKTRPTLAHCLVLLWTHYEPQLSDVENGLRAANIQPLAIRRLAGNLDADQCGARLRGLLGDDADFDEFALAWLKSLDRWLHQNLKPTALAGTVLTGVDGKPHRIYPRNNFIADTYEDRDELPTWVAQQGHSMAAYAPHVVIEPADKLIGKFRLELRRCDRSAWSRLQQLRDGQSLRVMMWPLAVRIDYPDLDKLRQTPPPEFVSLRDPRNEEVLGIEVEQALQEAARLETTVLIFPELAIPPRVIRRVRAFLARQKGHGHPILTVMGLCHACPRKRGADVNEAVVLGPNGTELYRHRKLAPFAVGQQYPCGERLQTGSTLTVLESPIGNLVTLICLDFFHSEVLPLVNSSLANVMLVPSLSPTTSAHQHSAATLGASRLASTFVCNRWVVDKGKDATSFYRVPRKIDGQVCHIPDHARLPYLLFEL